MGRRRSTPFSSQLDILGHPPRNGSRDGLRPSSMDLFLDSAVEVLDCTHLVEFPRDDDHDL